MMSAYDTGAHSRVSLAPNEKILWQGKPKKSAFVVTKSCTLLPIAIVWLIFDLTAIGSSVRSGEGLFFLIPFFALHMMPVWIWLGNTLTAFRQYNNTEYYVTDRRIILRKGILAVNETTLYFSEIRNVQMTVGLIDKIFGVGDVLFDTGMYSGGKNSHPIYHTFEELDAPREAYNAIQRIVLDMQTDMEYPNAFRPEENPGYNTEYRPR